MYQEDPTQFGHSVGEGGIGPCGSSVPRQDALAPVPMKRESLLGNRVEPLAISPNTAMARCEVASMISPRFEKKTAFRVSGSESRGVRKPPLDGRIGL